MSPRQVLRAVDASEWTGPIRRDVFRLLRQDRGVTVFLAQAWGGGPIGDRRNEYYHQAVDNALAEGCKVAAYCWPPSDWENCLEWMQGTREPVTTLALDVEAGAGVTPAMVQGLRTKGVSPVIYGSPSSWASIMGGSVDPVYAACPLWLARYVYSNPAEAGVWWPNDLQDAFGGYTVGGWTPETLGGWQFQGSTPIYGETFDLNLVYADMLDHQGTEENMEELLRRMAELQETVNLTRWSQAVADRIRADVALLDDAAAVIKGGRRLAAGQAARVNAVLERWS